MLRLNNPNHKKNKHKLCYARYRSLFSPHKGCQGPAAPSALGTGSAKGQSRVLPYPMQPALLSTATCSA